MKIRKGFVTNSSSSSFILGFTSEENIKKELEAEDPRWQNEAYAGRRPLSGNRGPERAGGTIRIATFKSVAVNWLSLIHI